MENEVGFLPNSGIRLVDDMISGSGKQMANGCLIRDKSLIICKQGFQKFIDLITLYLSIEPENVSMLV